MRIQECVPVSKLKTWEVVQRIGAAKVAAVEIDEPEVLAPEAEVSKPAKAAKTSKGGKKAKAEEVAEADA